MLLLSRLTAAFNSKNLLLFLFFVPFFTNAQEWNPINLHDKYNYQIETANYISHTIWVDSVDLVDGDSIFYLNRIVVDCPNCDPNFPNKYKIANQGQFLQEKMIKKQNGGYRFEGNQTFFLKPKTSLNESWIYDSMQNIQATVILIAEEDVLGNIDSVKTILLSNNDTLLLSKNHGIIQFAESTNQYSIRGIEGKNIGEQVPGFWDFYDFEIGDVFQYRILNTGVFSSSRRIHKWTVLDRIETDSSIVYMVKNVRSDTIINQFEPPI